MVGRVGCGACGQASAQLYLGTHGAGAKQPVSTTSLKNLHKPFGEMSFCVKTQRTSINLRNTDGVNTPAIGHRGRLSPFELEQHRAAAAYCNAINAALPSSALFWITQCSYYAMSQSKRLFFKK